MRLAIAVLCLLPLSATAQTAPKSVPAPESACASALNDLRTGTNILLDASIHGEGAFDRMNAQSFSPAVDAALKACRADDRAKRAIYDLQSRLSTYQAARDMALSILQSRPPTPSN